MVTARRQIITSAQFSMPLNGIFEATYGKLAAFDNSRMECRNYSLPYYLPILVRIRRWPEQPTLVKSQSVCQLNEMADSWLMQAAHLMKMRPSLGLRITVPCSS